MAVKRVSTVPAAQVFDKAGVEVPISIEMRGDIPVGRIPGINDIFITDTGRVVAPGKRGVLTVEEFQRKISDAGLNMRGGYGEGTHQASLGNMVKDRINPRINNHAANLNPNDSEPTLKGVMDDATPHSEALSGKSNKGRKASIKDGASPLPARAEGDAAVRRVKASIKAKGGLKQRGFKDWREEQYPDAVAAQVGMSHVSEVGSSFKHRQELNPAAGGYYAQQTWTDDRNVSVGKGVTPSISYSDSHRNQGSFNRRGSTWYNDTNVSNMDRSWFHAGRSGAMSAFPPDERLGKPDSHRNQGFFRSWGNDLDVSHHMDRVGTASARSGGITYATESVATIRQLNEARTSGYDFHKTPLEERGRTKSIVGEVEKLAKINVSDKSAIGLLSRLAGLTHGGGTGAGIVAGGGAGGGFLAGIRSLLGGGGEGGGSSGGGMFGQIGQQFRHAAIWQAYTPLIAGVGMMAAKAMGQGDYISKPQYGLIGVGYDEKMRRQSAEWALGVQHPYVQPQQHLNTLKEVSSALNMETTPANLKAVQKSAEITAMAAQFAMTDEANVARYTGRMKNILVKDPRYKHMSSPEAYNYVASAHSKIMQVGTAHLPEFYTAFSYAGQPMMQMGRTFEEASAEISEAVEQVGGKAGPAFQKLATGQSTHGKIAKAAIMRDILDANIAKYGLSPKAVHQTVLDTADKHFGAKGKLRPRLEGKTREVGTQVKTQRGLIVTMANYKKDIEGLAHNGVLKGSRGNVVDESLIPLLSTYGNINTAADVDEMLKRIKEKQGTVDLQGANAQGYMDQSFGSISGRFNKGMDIHYDSMRNQIGAPVYRWLNKAANSGAAAPQYLHSVASGNADEQARQIAVMRNRASIGEGIEITPQMYRGAQIYNQEGSKVHGLLDEGLGALVPSGDMISNYRKYGDAPQAEGILGWKNAAKVAGAGGALVAGGLMLAGAPFSLLGLGAIVGGSALFGASTNYATQTLWGMFKSNAPTLENFEKRANYEDDEKLNALKASWKEQDKIEFRKQTYKFWTPGGGVNRNALVNASDIGEWGDGPGMDESRNAPTLQGPRATEDQIFGYTKELASGGMNPTIIVPAPVVQVLVQTTAGGGVNVSSHTSGSAVNQPVQQGPSGIPESGPMSTFYNTPSGNLSGTQLHAPR